MASTGTSVYRFVGKSSFSADIFHMIAATANHIHSLRDTIRHYNMILSGAKGLRRMSVYTARAVLAVFVLTYLGIAAGRVPGLKLNRTGIALLGAIAALRKDGWFDHVTSVMSLAVTSLPEFVVAIVLIILFATVVLHLLPAVSPVAPGTYAWSQPRLLVLPVATLVIVIIPYIQRMMRAAMIEALESDYVEMARLKGVPEWQIVLAHAFPNSIAPTIQVIGLSFLYLAGGIVIVEDVFNFPGIGQGLVNAVSDRDIPVIQFIVVVLATFYVFMNIVTDVIALLVSPRRRIAR